MGKKHLSCSSRTMHYNTHVPQLLPGTCALVSWTYSHLFQPSHDQQNVKNSIVLSLLCPKLVQSNGKEEECQLKLYCRRVAWSFFQVRTSTYDLELSRTFSERRFFVKNVLGPSLLCNLAFLLHAGQTTLHC